MEDQTEKLKDLINSARKILITSHIGPDGDSVSSSLLLCKTLELNFPDKTVSISMEEKPVNLDFLFDAEDIQFQTLEAALNAQPPDLLIILDSNALHRVSRQAETVRAYLNDSAIKIAVIDHHQGMDIPGAEVHINNLSPAVTLDIYDIFLERFKLQKPNDYAQIALTGIYTDTGGFVYRNLNFRRVFEVVPQLLADGADIEKLVNNLNVISEKGLSILGELLANTRYEGDYTYSFVSDQTAVLQNQEALVQAEDIFRSQFLRSVKGRSWGFMVCKDVLTDDLYSVSFRAQSGGKDVSVIAAMLGGGGHKPAAGAKIKCGSVEEALARVKEVVNSLR